MSTRRIVLAAAAAVLVAAAALGVHLVARPGASKAAAPLDERAARDRSDGYRRDAIGHVPATIGYADAVRTFVDCPGTPGRYLLSSRYDLTTEPVATGVAFTDLRTYWKGRGYRVVNDTSGLNRQLLVENTRDGFRIGVSERTSRYVRLAISSPCLALSAAPVAPVLKQDIAIARGTYEQYVAGQLTQLTAQVGDLRAAVAADDRAKARGAWLAAQLTWERVGAAYGSFGNWADAIDGLPQGLPGGTGDPGFTGLHRVEYGLWHGESGAGLLAVIDQLTNDIGQLGANLAQATPGEVDLPLRTHEILEDALRDHLTGLTDQGGGAGLAQTWADVDATRALLDAFGRLIDARRPGLLTTIHGELDALRQALEGARDGAAWPSPAALDPLVRSRIDAALGRAVESLAQVPGLLELVGS